MKTIVNAQGERCYLSDETYQLVNESGISLSDEYRTGAHVHLISFPPDSDIPGYHFHADYYTVCRIDAPIAEFVGIKKSHLQLVTNQKGAQ